MDPVSLQTTHVLEMDNNEAALSLCLAAFDSHPEEGTLLAVGTAQGLSFYPRECQSERAADGVGGGGARHV